MKNAEHYAETNAEFNLLDWFEVEGSVCVPEEALRTNAMQRI